MKALCIKQPWAAMIAAGIKTIETRTWQTLYRGELLIVASTKPEIKGLLSGYAIATAQVADCRHMTAEDETAACCKLYEGAYSWVLKRVEAFAPFPVKGKLGFFNVEFQDEVDSGMFTQLAFRKWYLDALKQYFKNEGNV